MNEPTSSTPDSQKSPSQGKGFPLWWLYLFAFLLMWLLPLINGSNTGDEITWQQFEKDILSRKAVEKITIVNNERADIYIKKEMASDSMFYKVLKPSTGKEINAGPHYFINIGSAETFERKLDEAEKNFTLSEKIPVSYVKKTSWFWDIMAWVLP